MYDVYDWRGFVCRCTKLPWKTMVKLVPFGIVTITKDGAAFACVSNNREIIKLWLENQ